jgi:hypothetical protein
MQPAEEVSLKPKPKWRGPAAAALVLGVGGFFIWRGGVASKLLPGPDPARLQAASDPSKRFHVFVKSEPSGADIFMDGEVIGATPVTLPIDLNGKNAVKLILRKEGYEDYEQRIINEMPLSISLKSKAVEAPPKVEEPPSPAAPTPAPPAPPSEAEDKTGGHAHHHGAAKKPHGRTAAADDGAETPAPAVRNDGTESP